MSFCKFLWGRIISPTNNYKFGTQVTLQNFLAEVEPNQEESYKSTFHDTRPQGGRKQVDGIILFGEGHYGVTPSHKLN